MDTKLIFGPGGRLAQLAGDRYEQRPGQVKMAEAVNRCFRDGGRLLVEAPTGTGKSLAYLIPAAIAVQAKSKVVVVTANIALQEQLISKDLPTIVQALPDYNFTFALAKGIANYLCLDRWQDAQLEAKPEDQPTYDMLTTWLQDTKTGDLSELSAELPPRVRLSVVRTSDDCIGKKCDFYGECYGMAARRAYVAAQIVVTNYHLFFADLALRQATGTGGSILPDYTHVVLDEAHQAPDIARDFFGWRVSLGGIKQAIHPLRYDRQEAILRVADEFFDAVGRSDESPNGKRVRPRITRPGEVDATMLCDLLAKAAESLGTAAAIEVVPAARAKLDSCAERAAAMVQRLKAMQALLTPDVCVYYADPPTSEKGQWAVGMKPIDVDRILDPALFESESVKAVVCTSATLTSAGSFDFLATQLGAYAADELVVPSPFDYAGAAMLIVPTDLADPKGEGRHYMERVAEVVQETIRLARGRTLALFTSYRILEYTYLELQKAGLPYHILRQGDAPRTKLIQQFRDDIPSVLLGTASFWEGIDVQGESLSAVVIDRLPFDHPDDPVVQAICARDAKAFFTYMLPRSIIAFRQGFGRLIRARTDRGVIVLCDPRIVEKGYGSQYRKSMPHGTGYSRDIQQIRQLLG